MPDSQLVDPFGRRITYLRLSVTDRCDFRCTYCMSEDMQFLPRDQVLSLEELEAVADAFIGLGVKRIRITGGEPLVRKGLTGLLARLGARPELEDLSITTNGSQLRERAAELRAAGVRRLNISLDSLRRERFAAFTRSDRLEQVLDGIDAAREAGFERIKLNAVVQKGRNDDESATWWSLLWPRPSTSASSKRCLWAASAAMNASRRFAAATKSARSSPNAGSCCPRPSAAAGLRATTASTATPAALDSSPPTATTSVATAIGCG